MPVIAKFHQLFPLRGPIPLYRDLGHALVQSAIRTHEGSREAPGRSERRRGPGLLPTRGHWVCDMKVETTSPKAVITRGPSKMAPNATPTASEQVPANDGRCNAVNTTSKPVAAAICRLVSAPCSLSGHHFKRWKYRAYALFFFVCQWRASGGPMNPTHQLNSSMLVVG